MYGKDLFPLIQASNRAERFSENLMKWVGKYQVEQLFIAIGTEGHRAYNRNKMQASNLYIGFHSLDDGWLNGSRLAEILCNGAKAQTFAHPPKFKFEIIPGWFQRYIEGGKCIIDPEHTLYSDNERWQVSEDGKTRSCLWCNNHDQYEHMKMVPQYEWRSMPQTK